MEHVVLAMLEQYRCVSDVDYENALKEIMQEIALIGLWRAKFFDIATTINISEDFPGFRKGKSKLKIKVEYQKQKSESKSESNIKSRRLVFLAPKSCELFY